MSIPASPAREDVPASAPRTGDARLHLIDALRGFALGGVLLGNLATLTLYDYLDEAARAALPTAAFDRLALAAVQFFVDAKMITLFSLLFGIGFSLQMPRAGLHGRDDARRYRRRIGLLLAIGLLHAYLLWWGDILLIYALLAWPLLLFARASNRRLLWTGLVVALLLVPLLATWIDPVVARLPSMDRENARNLAVFSAASWPDLLMQNARYNVLAYAAYWGVLLFVFGRFLLGMLAGRLQLLEHPQAHRVLLRRLCIGGFMIGGTATCLAQFTDFGARFDDTSTPLAWLLKTASHVVLRCGPLGLGIAYGAGFALLWLWPGGRGVLQTLAPVGRMALSNYLVQTLVCIGVFYGVGLGVGPRYGLVGWLLTWAVLFAVQMVLSAWWLARFRFGPAEWLWRSLTHGCAQPMRVDAAAR